MVRVRKAEGLQKNLAGLVLKFRFQQIERQARKNMLGLWRNAKTQDMPSHVQRRLALSE